MPLILPGNVASATASTTYDVDNSCMFNGVDTYLSRTTSATAPTLSTKATLSFWIKMCEIAASSQDYVTYTNGAVVPYFNMQLPNGSSQQLALYEDGSSQDTTLVTTKVFRDPAAWYHVCYSYDSTPSTPSSSSIKLFINGVQQTAFSSETYPAQNSPTNLTTASVTHPIGVHANTSSQFLNAYLAEYMLVDGQALDADSFGEFDSDSPTIWKPIDISGITVGNQGYYLDFKDSSNLGNDVGGNDFDFTSNNIDATNQCQDSPTNNFVTLNPLNVPTSNPPVFSEGNTSSVTSSSGTSNFGGVTTIGLTKGKWYVEAKAVMPGTTRNDIGLVANQETIIDSNRLAQGHNTYEWSWEVGSTFWGYETDSGVVQTQTLSTYADGDIIALYLDLDNHKLYAAKNGTIQNSGVGLDIPAASTTPLGVYYFVGADSTGTSVTAQWDWNFGNGSYAGTAVSSAVADANGYGLFEYDPSDGGGSSFDSSAKDFYAICTKNLAEFG